MNTPTITTEELLDLSKSADLLRQTAEQALRCDSLARELHSTRTDRDYLAGVLERTHHAFDGIESGGPADFSDLPKAVETLVKQQETVSEALKAEVVTAGNHAACRLNVLRDIHRILGTDGLSNEANTLNALTGVPSQLARLPKRVEQLSAAVTTWRERYDKEVCKNEELRAENEMLARNVTQAPHEAIFWNPFNEVVQDHRDGKIIQPDTDKERAKRGLPPYPRSAPEPPAAEEVTSNGPVVLTYNPSDLGVFKVIGQAWCRSSLPVKGVGLLFPDGGLALCNIRQNVRTGAVTYVPIPFDELPQADKAAAP